LDERQGLFLETPVNSIVSDRDGYLGLPTANRLARLMGFGLKVVMAKEHATIEKAARFFLNFLKDWKAVCGIGRKVCGLTRFEAGTNFPLHDERLSDNVSRRFVRTNRELFGWELAAWINANRTIYPIHHPKRRWPSNSDHGDRRGSGGGVEGVWAG